MHFWTTLLIFTPNFFYSSLLGPNQSFIYKLQNIFLPHLNIPDTRKQLYDEATEDQNGHVRWRNPSSSSDLSLHSYCVRISFLTSVIFSSYHAEAKPAHARCRFLNVMIEEAIRRGWWHTLHWITVKVTPTQLIICQGYPHAAERGKSNDGFHSLSDQQKGINSAVHVLGAGWGGIAIWDRGAGRWANFFFFSGLRTY